MAIIRPATVVLSAAAEAEREADGGEVAAGSSALGNVDVASGGGDADAVGRLLNDGGCQITSAEWWLVVVGRSGAEKESGGQRTHCRAERSGEERRPTHVIIRSLALLVVGCVVGHWLARAFIVACAVVRFIALLARFHVATMTSGRENQQFQFEINLMIPAKASPQL